MHEPQSLLVFNVRWINPLVHRQTRLQVFVLLGIWFSELQFLVEIFMLNKLGDSVVFGVCLKDKRVSAQVRVSGELHGRVGSSSRIFPFVHFVTLIA